MPDVSLAFLNSSNGSLTLIATPPNLISSIVWQYLMPSTLTHLGSDAIAALAIKIKIAIAITVSFMFNSMFLYI